jgi:hypothetical protein
MQDRSYAIAIVVIIALCCLGTFVAIVGFFKSPPSLRSALPTPVLPATLLFVIAGTDTPAPSQFTATVPISETGLIVPPQTEGVETLVPPTPIGAGLDTPVVPSVPVPTAVVVPPTVAPLVVQSCSGFAFCPTGGPPDAQLAPTNDRCPRNYIWGRIIDLGKKGIPEMRVRFRGPLNNLDTVVSKGPPDPPGIYNILAPPPGGKWTLWMIDAAGKALSPQITITAPQVYNGSGNCPNRIDFVQQR